jgi:propionyl-CoA carboxylase alpha chain
MPMITTSDAGVPGRLPRRLLIANRGEIAVRIARTARAMGITPIGVASDPDASSLHARSCSEVVRLPGSTSADTYLRVDRLLEAAERTGADAVHPGFGFLAEDAGFARAVVDAGLTWVGPRPETIEAMGDKLAAKRTMATAGVPVLPGLELTTEHSDAEVRAAGEEVGFPLLVKATAGGGGKGMRTVQDASTLLDAVAAARREAAGAFGDDRVFLERLVARPRHLEVQILGDTHGQVLHLLERECSIQRRHQKVIEETPAPGITSAVRDALTSAAVEAARTLGYVNAGTVEFVGDETLLARLRAGDGDVDPRDAFAFLEVNTRLQVEHPVTEAVVRIRDEVAGVPRDLDLVRLQLLIAAGAPLLFGQDDVLRVGHAIEGRLYAEDPAAGYLPSTGILHVFTQARGAGIRWDSGVAAGDEVSPFYDPMLAKVIAHAPTRIEAASRLAAALDDTGLLGVTTNRDLLASVLRDEAFLRGDTTTAFLDERFPDGTSNDGRATSADIDLAAALAALHVTGHAHLATTVLPTLAPGSTSHGTFPVQHAFDVAGAPEHPGGDGDAIVAGGDIAPTPDRTVRLRPRRDGSVEVEVRAGLPAGFLTADGEVTATWTAVVHGVTEDDLDVEVDGHRFRSRILRGPLGLVEIAAAGRRITLVEVPRFPGSRTQDAPGATRSPMPGTVASVAVTVGQEVAAGELLVTVEAMKMEHHVTAAVAGTVVEVHVAEGDAVAAEDVLVRVDGDAQ